MSHIYLTGFTSLKSVKKWTVCNSCAFILVVIRWFLINVSKHIYVELNILDLSSQHQKQRKAFSLSYWDKTQSNQTLLKAITPLWLFVYYCSISSNPINSNWIVSLCPTEVGLIWEHSCRKLICDLCGQYFKTWKRFISRRDKQSCKVVDSEQAYSDFSNRDTESHVQHSDKKNNSKNNSQATSKLNSGSNLNMLHLKWSKHINIFLNLKRFFPVRDPTHED